MPKPHVHTIAPKDWQGLTPVLLALYEHGDRDGRIKAIQEIKRMALAADLYNESCEKGELVGPHDV